jgi:RNA polymerase-binding protein DksA
MAKKTATKATKKAVKKITKKTAKQSAKPKKLKPAKAVQIKTKFPETKAVSKKGFNKEELAHFKDVILAKRQEILEELESLKSTMMDVTTGQYEIENSTYSLHMEQGTDAMEREKTFLFASREGKFLNYLDDALKRIERGDYGFCTECGKLIDKERLEAVPHSTLCVKCKLQKNNP